MSERLLVIRARIGRLRLVAKMLRKPGRYCACCGDPLPRWAHNRLCDVCGSYAGVLVRAHESSRRRSLFG